MNSVFDEILFPDHQEVNKKNHPGWIYGKNTIVTIDNKQYYKQDEISFNTNKIINTTLRPITKDNYKVYNIND